MMMGFKGLICFIILLSCLSFSSAENVKVSIRAATTIARTDANFVCATLDWWPTDKCDYNQCPWGKAGLFNLDLENKILASAIKAFNPLRIRIGGSLQDQVVYKVGNVTKCPHFKKVKDGLFGFSEGCLPMERWDALNNLFNRTGAKITFGLNALSGRNESKTNKGLWVGDWRVDNSRDLMKYSIKKGYKIDSYEFGNELCGSGVSARVEAKQYGKDTIALKNLVRELYPDPKTQPKILGPGGFYDEEWFETFLKVTGQDVLDGTTHHIYNLGPGDDPKLITKIQDPFYLSQVAQTFKDVAKIVEKFAPWSEAWVSESGGAYNSGGKDVSRTFANGFWYLDQLGMTSNFNHKVYCRQALIGGNYALLNTTTFVPNPDYYGALLWHRLMGSRVISATQDVSPHLRVYAHCAKQKPGISLLFINLSGEKSFEVTLSNAIDMQVKPNFEFKGSQNREEYHLTPADGNIQSDVMLLNGNPLKLKGESDIPELKPTRVDPKTPISVASHSIVYVTIKDFHAPVCA
ncbi:heparanase-like protein 2 [Herrania umbratica]|uniref:Heparanase-like protein 2 n=1 Tax=Herrania umbratica TaxID=108875 RepID=A0A6J1BJN4_9ROSI|nr:heparanase-like protein 2 [Herrania umbratica]